MSISRIDQLKINASMLKKKLSMGDSSALEQLRRLPKFADLSADAILSQAQRKDYLHIIALEAGAESWQALTTKEEKIEAFYKARNGKQHSLLYPCWGSSFTNEWHRNYGDARASLEKDGGYLLVHHTDFFLVTAEYIERLGIDPQDPDWEAIGYDWAKPNDAEAFGRLFATVNKNS